MWDRDSTIIFCDLCIREIEAGNRPTTFFNKEGWQNVMVKFKELTGKEYDMMKFKNKWDQLKNDWKIWKELKRGSTGLGWDPIKLTIDAPESWWNEKLEVVPDAKKFKLNGINPILEGKLDGMFSGVVATGSHAFTPSEHDFISTPPILGTEHIGECGDGTSQIQRDVDSSCALQRPITEKSNKRSAFVRSSIDRLIDSCTVKSAASLDTSVEECLLILDTYVDVKVEKTLCINCVKLLQDSVRRDFFAKMSAETRFDFYGLFWKIDYLDI